MENRRNAAGVNLWAKARELVQGKRELLGHLGALCTGFVMAGSHIFAGLAPFGVAFGAAVKQRYAISAAAGAVLGYTFVSPAAVNMKYIVAMLMVLAARWLFEPKAQSKFQVAVSSVIAVFALGVASAAVLALGESTLYDLVMTIAELFLVCGATYFFARALATAAQDWSIANRSDLSCVVIALAVALMGISSLQVAGFSIGRIVAVVAVMLCARYGREAGGAIAGLTAGVALGLTGGDFGYLLTTYGFGGLVCGIFGGMGRIATAASFVFLNTITALFTRNYADVYTSIFEVFVASVVFVALPQSWIARLGLLRVSQTGGVSDTTTQKALCGKLQDISEALGEIATTTQQVSERLGRMETVGAGGIYTRVAEQVCLHCGMKTACWQFRYTETVSAMNRCIRALKKDGSISRQQVPKRFSDNCCKLDEFIAALNTQFHDHVAREGVQRKVSKVRSVVTDQFDGIALMLGEIAGDLGGIRVLEPAKGRRVQDYFKKEGLTVQEVLCYVDEYDRLTVELQIPAFQSAKLHKGKAALDLSDLLEADLDLPQVRTRDKHTAVQFCEKATFTIEMGACQISANAGRLCGDAYDYIRNQSGRAHFVLSDGMGCGGSAAVDSAMASGLITRLISVGVGYEAALKMVNSALLIKSGEESLATIDIFALDLFTGKAEFYKAGAAPTYVVKSGKASCVESTSLPAGILRGVSFEKSTLTLHEGDMVVMVSDGVIVTGADWVKSELECSRSCDMQRLCEKIANTAKLRRTDGREDDITVLAAQVQRGI